MALAVNWPNRTHVHSDAHAFSKSGITDTQRQQPGVHKLRGHLDKITLHWSATEPRQVNGEDQLLTAGEVKVRRGAASARWLQSKGKLRAVSLAASIIGARSRNRPHQRSIIWPMRIGAAGEGTAFMSFDDTIFWKFQRWNSE